MLYIVGTPIGNLKDITLRALDTLREVDCIACEDTRHTLALLNAYDIKKPLLAYHMHNEKEMSEKLVKMLEEGKNIALVSDAGMPTFSDPGAELVRACREAGAEVTVVPSATAATSALALCGIEHKGFVFLGFMPQKDSDKVAFLQKYAQVDLPLVFYVAPHDLHSDTAVMLRILGDRKVYAVKEITKLFEGVFATSLADFSVPDERGEFVLVVEGFSGQNRLLSLSIEEHLRYCISCGMDKKDAIKQVAKERGLSKSEVYKYSLDV